MKNKKKILVYYSILFLLLLTTWARESYISIPFRLAFLALVFIPIIHSVSYYFPCLVLFLTTSLLSFAGYTFMPTEPTIYLFITLFFTGVIFFKRKGFQPPNRALIFLLVLTICVNLIGSGKIEKVSYSLLIMLLLPITVGEKEKSTVVEILPKVFIVSTVAVAVLTILNRQLLIREIYEYNRLMSGSLNYTCCTLGIGFILALREFIKPYSTKFQKALYIFSMMILLITIVMEASRGALLSVVTSSVLIIMLNRESKRLTKIIVAVSAVLFLIVLYNNQFLDLLIYRIQNDTGTGSHRTEIWGDKLSAFFESSSFLRVLGGLGFEKTWKLGGAGFKYIGCHNDFVAFLIEYGLFGFVLFLMLLFYPLILAKTQTDRMDILSMIVYLVITCLTLEPFSMGYLPFCFFMLYVYFRSSVRTNIDNPLLLT